MFSQAVKAVIPAISGAGIDAFLKFVLVDEGRVLATDRRRLARSKYEVQEYAKLGEPFKKFWLPLDVAKEIAKTRSYLTGVEWVDDFTVKVTVHNQAQDQTMTFTAYQPEKHSSFLPDNLERLITDFKKADSTMEYMSINPDYMATWRRSTLSRGKDDNHKPINITFGTGTRDNPDQVKMIRMDYSEHFTALIMMIINKGDMHKEYESQINDTFWRN